MELTKYDIAAIRGCHLCGAKPEEIYTAFEGKYFLWQILIVIEDFKKEKANDRS